MARDPGRRPGDGFGPDDAAPGADRSPVSEEARDVPGAQAPEAVSDQRRLRRLLDAVVAISADLDTEAVLHHIVEVAADRSLSPPRVAVTCGRRPAARPGAAGHPPSDGAQ